MIATGRWKTGAGASGGERRDFEAKVSPHRASLRSRALQLTRNPEDAEDLVQKTMVRAFTRWDTFRAEAGGSSEEGSSARAWLYAILRTQFFSDYNSRKRKCGRNVSLETLGEDGGTVARCKPLSAASANPEQAVMAREEFQAVRRAVGKLPDSCREALALAVEEGLPYEEIAARLDLPIGTVRSRIHRARKRVERAVTAWSVGVA